MNEEKLKAIVCEEFLGGDTSFPIDADTRLLDEGICDSLGLVRLVARLEEACPGLRIQDQDVTHDTFGSISAILRFLQSKLKT